MDEITTTTTTRISELNGGRVRTYDFDPLEFIEAYAKPSDLAGGDPAMNAAITRSVLAGQKGPARDIVCLNAAAAIVAGGKAVDMKEGWKLANEAVETGKAAQVLDGLIKSSRAS
jgi:anthranilate phosphoribosyltransferase